MASRTTALEPAHVDFIGAQHIFFAASAAGDSHVNLSPRGTDWFRVLSPTEVGWLDLTGSGNETAAHIGAGGRLTLMFCAFSGPPLILRLYGTGTRHEPDTPGFAALLAGHFGGAMPAGARRIVTVRLTLVQTSCGYGVPRFEPVGPRDGLTRWAEKKGEAGLAAYRAENNRVSLDGLPG